MRPVVMVAAIGAAAVLGGVMGGALVRKLDRGNNADAIDQVEPLWAELTKMRSAALAETARVNKRFSEVKPMTEREREYHKPVGDSDSEAHFGRWFCGEVICSRSLAGCVDMERRVVVMEGNPDGSACKRTRIAFCRLDGGSCGPALRKCASDFSPCVGVE
jgi:hypothetical protein